MFKLLLQLAGLILSVIWSAFFKARIHPAHARPDPDAPSAQSLLDGHELSDARPKIVAILAASLFLVIFATMAALGWLYTRFYTRASAMPVPEFQASFKDAPFVRTSIEKDWAAIDAQAHRRLDDYRWVDQPAGIVQIPIARAMDLISRQGLPARAGAAPAFPQPAEEKMPVSDSLQSQHPWLSTASHAP